MADLLVASMARLGANPAHVYSDVRPWAGTFADLDRSARALASAWRADGVEPGAVVVMQLPNWAEAAVVFWAAIYAGAVIVPVVPFYGAKEVQYIVRTMRPDVVVTADRFRGIEYLPAYEALVAGLPGTRWLVVGDSDHLPSGAGPIGDLLDGDPTGPIAQVDPDEPVLVAFTSGTTSDPKGVIHTHRTLAGEMTQQTAKGMVHKLPSMLTGAPVGHFAGMLGAFLRPLMTDTSIRLIDVWDPGRVLALMRSEGLVMGGGATYFLTSLLDHPDFTESDLERMPVVGLGGSPVPAAVTRRATDLGITVFRSYGSTEHPSATGCSATDPEDKRLNTDGRPLGGVEIRLDDGGQIWTRGPDLCVGYTDPTLTASRFDADGWYQTGDVGVFDDDGYLAITDRVSDIIIRGGENISAQEVEELVLQLTTISEVAVVAEADPRFGEHTAAIVTLRPGAVAPTREELHAHLRDAGLARPKWPDTVYHVTEFPRTPSGKIQKFRLREQLRQGALGQAN